jgi:large subunit ribosomal protein L7/L12
MNETIQELSDTANDIISKIETMTVLELSKMVKVMEDKFGVVAVAPASVNTGVTTTDNAQDTEDVVSTVNVILTNTGDKKLQVLKVIREVTGLGLKEAKDLVDTTPKSVKENIEKEEFL